MGLFRTAEIIKASKLPPEGVKLSRMIDAIYFIPIAYFGVFATFHMHFDLLAGDWDWRPSEHGGPAPSCRRGSR